LYNTKIGILRKVDHKYV